MHKSIKATVCAMALTLIASPFAVANFGPEQLSVSHMAQPTRPAYQAVARCVDAIQQHWDARSKLVLDLRARLRNTETQQVLLVGGAVWENGERVRIEHECVTSKSTPHFALRVQSAEQALVASQ